MLQALCRPYICQLACQQLTHYGSLQRQASLPHFLESGLRHVRHVTYRMATLGRRAQTLRVRRLLDEKNQTLLYIAYSTRLNSSSEEGISSGRYRHVTNYSVLHI